MNINREGEKSAPPPKKKRKRFYLYKKNLPLMIPHSRTLYSNICYRARKKLNSYLANIPELETCVTLHCPEGVK